MAMTRRTWLKVGILGGAALTAAGLAGRGIFFGEGTDKGAAAGRTMGFLTRRDCLTLGPIIAAVLEGADAVGLTPEERVGEVLLGVDQAVLGLLPAVQDEVRQLLTLLALPPARWLLVGIWPAWEKARPDQVRAFLERWRTSNRMLLRSAYEALHELILAAWYGNQKSWPAIGYGGPPRLAQ